jgi:phospholipase C
MKNTARNLLVLVSLSTALVHAQISSFKNVIVIFQENRTPDNLFQGLCATAGACSIIPTGKQYNIQTSNWLDKTSATGKIQPLTITLANTYDLSHAHSAWVAQCDKNAAGTCVMDGAAGVTCTPQKGTSCPTQPQFRYAVGDPNHIPPYSLQPYLDLATQYAFANYMFQTNEGPSFPAHQFIFGATSAYNASNDALGVFASENMNPPKMGAGCIANSGVTVKQIDSTGNENNPMYPPIYPCFFHQALSDLLEARSFTWEYYAKGAASIWTAPSALEHICGIDGGASACPGTDWTEHVDATNPSDVLTAIQNCTLGKGQGQLTAVPQVTWITPTGQNSDHASSNTGGGPAWVASIVNAIGNSWTNSGNKCDYWGANSPGNETAIIIAWDDWGGWYDHEPPAVLPSPQGGYQFGFRVPMIVVSAYTPVQVVNNKRHDFGSILRFIEQNYGLGNLGFADTRCDPSWANCQFDNLSGFFNYAQAARTFTTIQAAQGAEYFIHDKTPPTDPDDD